MRERRKRKGSAYKSFKFERLPISFGILPVNSFHMKSLPNERKQNKISWLKKVQEGIGKKEIKKK